MEAFEYNPAKEEHLAWHAAQQSCQKRIGCFIIAVLLILGMLVMGWPDNDAQMQSPNGGCRPNIFGHLVCD